MDTLITVVLVLLSILLAIPACMYLLVLVGKWIGALQ